MAFTEEAGECRQCGPALHVYPRTHRVTAALPETRALSQRHPAAPQRSSVAQQQALARKHTRHTTPHASVLEAYCRRAAGDLHLLVVLTGV